MLAAFSDRFLVRVFLEPIADPQLEELLERGRASSDAVVPVALADVDALGDAARAADLSAVRPQLAHAIRVLRQAGVVLTDRRVVKLQNLVAAAAVLGGRAVPSTADLWPVVYAIPTVAGQRTARQVLRELLADAENRALPAAAAEASAGRLARAGMIVRSGQETIAARPDETDTAAQQAWRLRLEGIAREIDAGFATDTLPDDLRMMRAQIVDELAPS
jgi:MoxR-like ATPase